jgi:hypothetical protein
MSMIAAQMGEYIKSHILSVTAPVWTALGINDVTAENIWNDLARCGAGGIEATFYVTGLDNVVRKDFNAQADVLKKNNPRIAEFKVKYKRPEKEVRFYIKINKEISNDQQSVPEQTI